MAGNMGDKTMKSGCLVAVDGGGTKTEIRVLDLATGAVSAEVFGSANYKSSSEQTAVGNIVVGLSKVFEAQGVDVADVRGAVFGIAGCDTEGDLDFYRRTVATLGIASGRTFVCNDSEMALLASVDEGICIVAGTGSIVTGIAADGRKTRAGGWGAPMGDEGSGWWIANEVFKSYLRWADGVDAEELPYFKTITQSVGGGEIDRAVARIARMSTSEEASHARDIMEHAQKGEQPCARVVKEAAGHLAEIARCAYHALGFETKAEVSAALVGSLFNSAEFRKGLKDELERRFGITNIRLFRASDSPAACGLELAKKLFLD